MVGGGRGLGGVGRCHGVVWVLVLVLVFVGKSGDSPLRCSMQNSARHMGRFWSGHRRTVASYGTAWDSPTRERGSAKLKLGASLSGAGRSASRKMAGWRPASAGGRGLRAARPLRAAGSVGSGVRARALRRAQLHARPRWYGPTPSAVAGSEPCSGGFSNWSAPVGRRDERSEARNIKASQAGRPNRRAATPSSGTGTATGTGTWTSSSRYELLGCGRGTGPTGARWTAWRGRCG